MMSESNISGSVSYRASLAMVTFLFFMWGLITSLNDILIPHLKAAFSLSYMQAALVQFCFFGAYAIVSWPAGRLVARVGYRRGIILGLSVAAAGCLLFYPGAGLQSYSLFLSALFVLASGITLLQVSANPYVTRLGASKTAESRLNLAQAFNSLGTTVGPLVGALFILSTATDSSAHVEAHATRVPYLTIAAVLVVSAYLFSIAKMPAIVAAEADDSTAVNQTGALLSHRPLMLGVLAIFLYVGGEVAVGSFLISFLENPNIGGLDARTAAGYLSVYWAGAMVGRFIGSAVMKVLSASGVLAFNAACASGLLIAAINTTGSIAMWSVIAIGLCNSIMFPTIFALAIRGLGKRAAEAAGLLCMAIVGGALVPIVQGLVADRMGLGNSFIVPMCCYLYVTYYGLTMRHANTPRAR